MADLPALWEATTQLAQDPVARTRLLDAAWKLLLLIGLGLVAEAVLVRALARTRRWLDAAAPPVDAEGGVAPLTWLKRLPLLLGRLLLDLVPIAGFAVAVYGLFGLVNPLPTTRLVGLMMAHAYMGARAAFALARVLLSPASNHLRLIPCSDAAAAASIGWLRRLMLVGVGGYTLAEAGLFLGLPWAAYDAILNVTLLVISLLLVRLVLQQREAVADVPAGQSAGPDEVPDRTRLMLRGARDRLAEIWHVLVILWLVASWVVWALALENGFQRLLWGTVADPAGGRAGQGAGRGLHPADRPPAEPEPGPGEALAGAAGPGGDLCAAAAGGRFGAAGPRGAGAAAGDLGAAIRWTGSPGAPSATGWWRRCSTSSAPWCWRW